MFPPLSIETSGQWSPRQADAVCAALADELAALGLEVIRIDITTQAGPRRELLIVRCATCHAVDAHKDWCTRRLRCLMKA